MAETRPATRGRMPGRTSKRRRRELIIADRGAGRASCVATVELLRGMVSANGSDDADSSPGYVKLRCWIELRFHINVTSVFVSGN